MLKNIKIADLDLSKIKGLYIKYKPKLKKYALPIVVMVSLIVLWVTGAKAENTNGIEAVSSEDISADENIAYTENPVEIYVDISGEIVNPGVYKVNEGERVFRVIEMAGGLTDEADTTNINQAEAVYDGEKIIVPNINEAAEYDISSSSAFKDGKVNINNADLTALETLPGIGISKAQKIIDYRNANGKYKKISDIKNVSGIGDQTYESLKDLICI